MILRQFWDKEYISMEQGYSQVHDAADLLYGSYIKYDRMYEMTKYAFYGKTDSETVNIYIDVYSVLRSLYSRGPSLQIRDSYAIASCLINLAIHTRAYFESRHRVTSKVYLIYGAARPREAFVNFYQYNGKNILAEDSDFRIKSLVMDNLEVLKILCPYLYDIFCIVDMENEFNSICSMLIDDSRAPNIVYSKDALSYQLVAFKPFTFLYRPKKSLNQDVSWVVTKSTLYDAYRHGELKLKKHIQTDGVLDPKMFSIYQAINGVRTRNMSSIKNANSTLKLLVDSISKNIFSNGYNANAIFIPEPNPFEKLFDGTGVNPYDVIHRFAAIDLNYQTSLYKNSPNAKAVYADIINLYNPQTVRDINDKYFQLYPLDLNRV